MGLTDVKRELKKLDKDKIIDLIADLYKKNKAVKEYLDFYANPNEKELFEKYRNKVYESLYPKRGYNYSLKEGKQAINEFKKLGTSTELLADLMLFYVETGVEFTNEFGDIGQVFYSSMESTFDAALKLMKKENLLDKFEQRTAKVVNNTRHIGWGFYGYLKAARFEYYGPHNK